MIREKQSPVKAPRSPRQTKIAVVQPRDSAHINDPSLDTRMRMPPILATKKLPDVSKFKGGVHQFRPGQITGTILAPDLDKVRLPNKPAQDFRPNWLNLRYYPQILPRYRRLPTVQLGTTGVGPLAMYRGELSNRTDFPYSTIGKVFVYSHGVVIRVGSGVMVGPNILLTAAHLLPDTTQDWAMYFVPAYYEGDEPFGGSWVEWAVPATRPIHIDTDYAVCKTYARIGETCGWMGHWWSYDDEFYEDRWWDSVGYPVNFFEGNRPCVEWGQRPESADEDHGKVQIHLEEEFATGGWSGGPLFGYDEGSFWVVAVCFGRRPDWWWEWDSVFSGGPRMCQLIAWAWDNWA